MAWKDVCKRGNPAGGEVRQDDVKGSDPKAHDAGGTSPGMLDFIDGVIRGTPRWNPDTKPADFPNSVGLETYPGRGKADVHLEGRAVDVFLNVTKDNEKKWGDWLFDWCMNNCRMYKIQGVIFGGRQWFSEMHGGREFPRTQHDHDNHVHIELNCDGAAKSGS